jgi:predicted nucleic acid-binding protein
MMIRVVIDASVLLKAYFRDERGQEAAQELMKLYARGDYDFIAPSLITYEIMNACSIAHREGRIGLDLVREILNAMFSLEILKKDIDPLRERIFEISCQFSQSAYDASYVALAEAEQCDFVTGDEKLYRAISKDFSFLKLL